MMLKVKIKGEKEIILCLKCLSRFWPFSVTSGVRAKEENSLKLELQKKPESNFLFGWFSDGNRGEGRGKETEKARRVPNDFHLRACNEEKNR